MRVLSTLGLAVVVAAIAGIAYVRLAPSDPADWHIDPRVAATEGKGAHFGLDAPVIYAAAPQELLARLDAIIMATPRTERLAGSVAEGQITYITRSALIGYPDYTTVAVAADPSGGTRLYAYGRQRFGLSDLGVNAQRLEAWRSQLGPAVAAGTALDAGRPSGNDEA